MRRQSYQNGCVYEDTRKERRGFWYLKWRDADGIQRTTALGKCANRLAAKKEAAKQLPAINGENKPPKSEGKSITMTALVDRYVREKLPERYSTQRGYLSYLNTHIVPKWGEMRIDEIKPYDVDAWLQKLPRSQKSKSHIKGLMHLLFECAMFWEHIPLGRNPMELVTVRGRSKRTRTPVNLKPEQFQKLMEQMTREPFRTMSIVAACLGLRFSELTGLKWADIDWMEKTVHIQRGVVRGKVDETKTTSSNVQLPLDGVLLEILKSWRVNAEFKGDADWVFASPYFAGKKPYAYSHMLRSLKAAGAKVGAPGLGWHGFRHSFRTWMKMAGTDVPTMQKLMRHSDVRMTMKYGTVFDEELRRESERIQRNVLQNCSAKPLSY